MIIKLTHNIRVDPNTKNFPIHVYVEGSGNPADEHKILAVVVDYHSFGTKPELKDVDKFEDREDILV